jgi:integrase
VFNYAKNDLGLITVNPAGRITIPEVRVTEVRARGYSPQELAAMWNALQDLRRECRHSSRYWAPVLSLYHGFRLNEVCSLFIKDVYEDEDGVFVMDINADGPFKSVKNKSSVRIVPVHPFVRDRLDFKGYVELQKNTRTEGILFPDVSGTRKNGYIRRTSRWFAKWKQSWLPEESLHKHFHDLRYTFIRTAQNDAKMSDRCSQEITGHSVSGVSAVHLGYSGRLKPAAVLEELQKIRYGWE